MKKIYFYLLLIFAVTPIAAFLIFDSSINKVQYFIENQRGNIQAFGGSSIEVYSILNRNKPEKLILSSEGIAVIDAPEIKKYGDYFKVKNRSFFKDKPLVSQWMDEDENYSLYAFDNHSREWGYYINLFVKDNKSEKESYVSHSYSRSNELAGMVTDVIITGEYANVFMFFRNEIDSGSNSYSLSNYIFNLETGEFVDSKTLLTDGIRIRTRDINSENEIYIIYNDLDTPGGTDDGSDTKVIRYNPIDGTAESYVLPEATGAEVVLKYNDAIYLLSSLKDNIIRLQEDGKVDYSTQLMGWGEDGFNSLVKYMIKDDKIFLVGREEQKGSGEVKYIIKVIDLDGQELYYGEIATAFGDGSKSNSYWMLSGELR